MELFEIRGGEMQKEGPGEMASSFKSWVHAPHLHWFLWPFPLLCEHRELVQKVSIVVRRPMDEDQG